MTADTTTCDCCGGVGDWWEYPACDCCDPYIVECACCGGTGITPEDALHRKLTNSEPCDTVDSQPSKTR